MYILFLFFISFFLQGYVTENTIQTEFLSKKQWMYLQKQLDSRRGSIFDLLGEQYKEIALQFKIIGDHENEFPVCEEIAVNKDLKDKENCLILYASFNRNYPAGLQRLVEQVKNSDFKGHILYRIGGWPDIEGGGLSVIDIPYAFKVCMFNEAKRKGFKRVLFLDTSIIPVVSLNKIFQYIENDGFFVMSNFHNVGPYSSKPVLSYFGVSLEKANHIPSCSIGFLGVDFNTRIGTQIIERWYKAAKDKKPFFSPRPEQTCMSLILYHLKINEFFNFFETTATNSSDIKESTLFFIDKEFVHQRF